MNDMQNINWERMKEILQICVSENKPYIREFRMRNGDIVLVVKYSHTGFRITQTNSKNVTVLSQKISTADECYDTIYKLVNK